MFTGIIEAFGTVKDLTKMGSNLNITIESVISQELKIDQSLAHNGVCLTVVAVNQNRHTITAIQETLERSNLGQIQTGDLINLERAMQLNARLDGHLVQGHVDTVGVCTAVDTLEGSWYYTFSYPKEYAYLLVDKGSICVNGVSLTLVNPTEEHFSVAIIPYTYEHTNFKQIEVGTHINIEFDIIGKYIARGISLHQK